MYVLYDTFNKKIVSRHRSVEAVAKAAIKHDRAVKRHNGQSSYIPTFIRLSVVGDSGEPMRVSQDDCEQYEQCLVEQPWK